MKRLRALTIGGAMIDTIAIIDSNRIERMSMANADSSFLLLEEGRKTEASEVSTHTGGGAINAAVAMARLGLSVAVIAKLGKDARAQTILERLREEGISTNWIAQTAEAATGASVLVASHEKDAAIFTFRGSNVLLEPEDLAAAAFVVDMVYVSTLSNRSADCFPAIVDLAKTAGALLVVNPGIRQLSARGGAFHRSLPKIDVLIANRAEAEALLPEFVAEFGEGGPTLASPEPDTLPRLAIRGLTGGGFDMSLARFLTAMLQSGPRVIVLTDSHEGSFAAIPGKIYHCPIIEGDVAGTAGAGDAFGATFACAIAQGADIEDALLMASVNASSVVGHVDTQTGLLSSMGIKEKLESVRTTTRIREWPLPSSTAKGKLDA